MGSQDSLSARVSAADFVRSFGIWRERASEFPVTITNHGRDTHVLLSARTFAELVAPDAQAAPAQATSSMAEQLLDTVRECILIVDSDMVVKHANAAACGFLRSSPSELEDVPLERAMPNFLQSFARRGLLRTLSTGERTATDVPSSWREGLWLHVQTLPVDMGAAIIFHDITSEVQTNRDVEVKQAILEAMGLDGSLGYARISPREMIEDSDQALRTMVGLSENALARVKFSAMIVPRARPAFHEALEKVFSQHCPTKLESCLLSNSGAEISVQLSIVELRGEFASEGAIIAISAS